MSTQRPNKLQVDTASEVLNKALNDRRDKLGREAFKKDFAKKEPLIKELVKRALELRKFAEASKPKIEKDVKFQLGIGSGYGWLNSLPKSMDEGEFNSLIQVKGSGYSNILGEYRPDLKAEQKEVDDFILGLKLGTAIMADLQLLVDRINKAK